MSTRSPANALRPDFSIEERYSFPVCGLDEVGRAPLAGPVVAACVLIVPEKRNHDVWAQVTDSKKLTKKRREDLFERIKDQSAWAIAEAGAREIEEHNIVQASFLAMRRAYKQMCASFSLSVEAALIDGHLKPEFPCEAEPIVKGDMKSVSIAAASILAKVYRDRLMSDLARVYPHYGWESNAAYPTPQHLEAINIHGITDHHRRSFAPVRNYLDFGSTQAQRALPL